MILPVLVSSAFDLIGGDSVFDDSVSDDSVKKKHILDINLVRF